MELSNEVKQDEKYNKLLLILDKITGPQYKLIDKTYREKLLTGISFEYSKDCTKFLASKNLDDWLFKILKLWTHENPNFEVIVFFWQFIGILVSNEEGFTFLEERSVLDALIRISSLHIFAQNSLKLAFVKCLSKLLKYNSGYLWVIKTKKWKMVVRIICFKNNFYVQQEVSTFFKELFIKDEIDPHFATEVFQEILHPLVDQDLSNEGNINLLSSASASLKLLEEIMKTFILSENKKYFLLFMKIFDIEKFLKFFIEHCTEQNSSETAARLYVTVLILQSDSLLHLQSIPPKIQNLFLLLLELRLYECVIKLSKFCYILMKDLACKKNNDCRILQVFIKFQVVPILLINNLSNSVEADELQKEIFSFASETNEDFWIGFQNSVKNNRTLEELVTKSILSLSECINYFSQAEVNIVFKGLVYSLKRFVHTKLYEDTSLSSINKNFLNVQDRLFLSPLLNNICTLLKNFSIFENEHCEAEDLIIITCNCVERIQLPPVLVVQNLLLVKLVLTKLAFPMDQCNSIEPNKNCLTNLMSLLFKHMFDPNWEIRDSCVEVVTAIAKIVKSRSSRLQDLLVEKGFCSLIFHMIEKDSESYVRASALRALTEILKIKDLHNYFPIDFTEKIIELLVRESEGIVRREAVLVIKEIYQTLTYTSDIAHTLYPVMCYTAVCDLHWEVKVNSLLFWEVAVQKVFNSIGCFEFNKIHDKLEIKENIKQKLYKALEELSTIGCLYVLLKTVSDDCDFPVIQCSANILSQIVNNLKCYDIIKVNENFESSKLAIKRKGIDDRLDEKKKAVNEVIEYENTSSESNDYETNSIVIKADTVIEEIVSNTDINLLVSVCCTKDEGVILKKKFQIKRIKPEVFICQMQSFDIEKYLDSKKKWLTDDIDLNSLMNDFLDINFEVKTISMDCY